MPRERSQTPRPRKRKEILVVAVGNGARDRAKIASSLHPTTFDSRSNGRKYGPYPYFPAISGHRLNFAYIMLMTLFVVGLSVYYGVHFVDTECWLSLGVFLVLGITCAYFISKRRVNVSWATKAKRGDLLLITGTLTLAQMKEVCMALDRGVHVAMDGIPGFNFGFFMFPKECHEKAHRLTSCILNHENAILIHDGSVALLLTNSELLIYYHLLGTRFSDVAKAVRIAMLTSQKGNLENGGPYGRMYCTMDGTETFRDRDFYIEYLIECKTIAFDEGSNHITSKLDNCINDLSSSLSVKASTEEIIGVCDRYFDEVLTKWMKSHASQIFNILLVMDEKVGVMSAKLFDAPFVLAAIAKYCGFLPSGIGYDDSFKKVKDRELLRDWVFTLMDGTTDVCLLDRNVDHIDETLEFWKHALEQDKLEALQSLTFVGDFGADPNDDDAAALKVVMKLLNLFGEITE